MTAKYDFSTFSSRLHFQGTLRFDSAVRIGSSRSTRVDDPDLPILRDAIDRPYIPGSSFKGALRSYIESILRSLQVQDDFDSNLACLSVGKPLEWEKKEEQDLCLTIREISSLKDAAQGDWKGFEKLPPHLQERLFAMRTQVSELDLDEVLRALNCWTCRVFGSSCLASKVLIKDLDLAVSEMDWPADTRDGVAIDRDSGRAADGMLYQFEALAPGVPFNLEILVENASDAELGLLWLGISAFMRGDVLLGGAKSRGLGWCTLIPEWDKCSYIDQTNLLDAVFGELVDIGGVNQEKAGQWVRAFQQAIRIRGK